MATETRNGRVGLPLQGFPSDLKQRIADVAERDASNLNDIAVGALAAEFGVTFEATGRRSRGLGASDYLNLEMPPELRRRINVRAAEQEKPAREVVIEVLARRVG